MATITKISKAAARRSSTAAIEEVSEFDGFWINVGVYMGEGDDATFVRMPRGIAVSDLKHRKVYESMDPEFAAQVETMNEMITAIQEACLSHNNGKPMEEGQSIPINFSAVLYRRQEEAETVKDKTTSKAVRAALFGKATA